MRTYAPGVLDLVDVFESTEFASELDVVWKGSNEVNGNNLEKWQEVKISKF